MLAISVYISLLCFFIISMDRYLAISKPVWHRANATKKQIIIAVSSSWSIAFVMSISTILKHSLLTHSVYADYYNEVIKSERIFGVLGVLIFLVDCLLFVLTYTKAMGGLQNRHKLTIPINEAGEIETQQRKHAQMKMFKVLSLMFAGFVLAYLAVAIAIIMQAADIHDNQKLFYAYKRHKLYNPQ